LRSWPPRSQLTPLHPPLHLQRLSTVGDLDYAKPEFGANVVTGRAIEQEPARGHVVDPIAHGRQHQPVTDVDAELITAAPAAGVAAQAAERPEAAGRCRLARPAMPT